MYFSIAEIRGDRAKQLAVMAAAELSEHMLGSGKDAHVAFETTVVHLAEHLKRGDTAVLAAQLLNSVESEEKRVNTIKIGMKEMSKLFGGAEPMMSFFRQATMPKAAIRFESVGGVQHDIHAAKNRSAMLAAKALQQRRFFPEVQGLNGAEREYVDYLKSVRRTMDKAVENGTVKPELASELAGEIEEAAYAARPEQKGQIIELQLLASEELMEEARNKLIRQYSNILQPTDPALKSNAPESLSLH